MAAVAVFRNDVPRRILHVAAVAVFRNDRHEVLIGTRPDDKDYPGMWEFPGGKVDSGERPADAAAREAHEELGIVPTDMAFLGSSTFDDGGEVALHMTLWAVDDYDGTLEAHVAPQLAWAAADELSEFAMPPLDVPLVALVQREMRAAAWRRALCGCCGARVAG